MTVKDQLGLELSGASQTAAELYRTAADAYHCFAGDSFTPLRAALADSPRFVMAHALMAWMTLVGANTEIAAMGARAYEAAKDLPATERERGHLVAIGRLARGEIRAAARVLEDVSIAHPHDVLALQVGQTLDFMLGDARMLRDRIGRALPAWSPDMPNWHAVQGQHAFGLEETGLYDRAEAAGRAAVALQPRNNWAQHAVAHVMIMQGRHAEGLRWMRHDNTAWQPEAQLGVHNWWHTALFHLGLDETDPVLDLFDGPIYGARTNFAFDMGDAAALLWRLHLRGVEVGDRWDALADNFAGQPRGQSAFVDTHAMMAFVGAGREAEAEALLATQAAAAEGPGDNAQFVRDVGLATVGAIHAFGQGRYDRATDLLRDVRSKTHRFGGSHAQRDVLDLTLIAAARADGQTSLERALLAERAAAQPLAA